ncbi:MAG: DUF5049 domain-containing protein [Eubacteriales bacterium]|nr:DUF5049 domain-containing protein [Eubacteriales bacterium]
MTEKLKAQIEELRRSGKTNMLDVNAVQYYANEMNLYELVVFLIDQPNRKRYFNYILTGEDPAGETEEN